MSVGESVKLEAGAPATALASGNALSCWLDWYSDIAQAYIKHVRAAAKVDSAYACEKALSPCRPHT